ncbi:Ubiquinone/menaquinone biosynthesis C-methylase UbiE [Mycobacterium rhizamassiliense]|uniref:Ubiquinone/menaquinone biosynthesis C-methylase UbiE n=1 Tax=Mycobacterium rhizamassiliense TaxID=1841860 RepID=A0A2U3NZI0_9MYCO|nr:Ubiquinone/menaquinone biosynthesis C-methylase UbiE [Mycobacterium rhizamassiliense]
MVFDDAVAMVGTYSRVIVASPEDRERRLAHARASLEARFPGAEAVDVPMRAFCWRADRMAR